MTPNPNPDQNRDRDRDREDQPRRRQPGVSGDLVAPLRTLREVFGPDQVQVTDVTHNPPRMPPRHRNGRGGREEEERQR